MESMMLDCSVLAFPFRVADSEPGASGVTGLDNPLLACGVSVPFKFGVPGLYYMKGRKEENSMGHETERRKGIT
jgi:hypothetical protein